MLNQTAPFGMYGLGQLTGWPQYPNPIAQQLLQGYQQDPYGLLARQVWAQTQATNPWAVQALLGELVGAIARQSQMSHIGMGHHTPFGVTPFGVGLGQIPFGAGIGQQLPFTMGLGQQVPFTMGLGQQLPFTMGLGQHPFAMGMGQLPLAALLQQQYGNPFGQQQYGNPFGQQQYGNPFGQGSYGIGAGLGNGVGGAGFGTGVPFPAAAGAWSAPTMAMV